jgi:hypothetical protein
MQGALELLVLLKNAPCLVFFRSIPILTQRFIAELGQIVIAILDHDRDDGPGLMVKMHSLAKPDGSIRLHSGRY